MTLHNHQGPYRHIIQSYEKKALKKRSAVIKLADSLTSFFGSFTFLAINIIFFTVWVLINSGAIPGISVLDPFPYVLLTTAVSLEAIMLTIIVLMSQNRQSQISALREELSLQVELIAEKEITKTLLLLNELLIANKVKIKDDELADMLKKLDHSYIERKLEEQLMAKPKGPLKKLLKKD